MFTEIKIRTVQENDMLTVYEQICDLEDFSFNINDFRIIFLNNINDKNNLYYLAEDQQGDVVGFISCHIQYLLHHCGRVAEIQELFVKKTFRGMGIGGKLIHHMEEMLKELACVSLEVTAQNKRTDTHAFYQNIGFNASHLKFTKNI